MGVALDLVLQPLVVLFGGSQLCRESHALVSELTRPGGSRDEESDHGRKKRGERRDEEFHHLLRRRRTSVSWARKPLAREERVASGGVIHEGGNDHGVLEHVLRLNPVVEIHIRWCECVLYQEDLNELETW